MVLKSPGVLVLFPNHLREGLNKTVNVKGSFVLLNVDNNHISLSKMLKVNKVIHGPKRLEYTEETKL